MLPELETFDHVHVHVVNRAEAEVWYRDVLGLFRAPEFEFWAADGGPLFLHNRSGSIHLALFERNASARHATIAFRVGAAAYLEWKTHLQAVLAGQVTEEDHDVSWSLYFTDPDGNPFEVTTYEV